MGAVAPSLAPVTLRAQAQTPAALFHESSVAARGTPTSDTTRIGLLRRIAHEIIWVGDVDSALVLGRFLGPWRREVQTDAICRLLSDDRFDDAYQLVRRFPEEDRDWALANLSVRLVRPLQSPGHMTLDSVDFALHDRALAVAREIRSPEPQVHAFLSIANRLRFQRDTARARVAALGALTALPRIRDRDIASSRARGILSHLGSAYADSVPVLRRTLLPRDRDVATPGIRATTTPSVIERAVRLAPSDFRAALALVDTLDDPLSYGRHARAIARVVLAAPKASSDTAALVLRRARELAVARGLSPRQSSLTLLEIAEAQIGHGLFDDAAATLNAIPVREIALSAFRYPYGLHLRLSKPDGQRFLAALGDTELRAAAAASVIGPWVEEKDVSQADFDLVISVVDSLPRTRSAEAAQNLVARASFFRGDTAAARDRALSVLHARDREWTRWKTYPFGDELTYWVVRSGGLNDAVAWARALPSPASRAAGLLEIGEALDDVTHLGNPIRHHPLLDTCRDDF